MVRGGRKVEMRMVIMLRMTKMRKVHQPRRIDNAQRPPATTKRPKYHQALRPGTMYSSACHETSCNLFTITIL